jgi:hypothetical protein
MARPRRVSSHQLAATDSASEPDLTQRVRHMNIPGLDTIAALTCLNTLALRAHRGHWKRQPGRTLWPPACAAENVPLASLASSVVTPGRWSHRPIWVGCHQLQNGLEPIGRDLQLRRLQLSDTVHEGPPWGAPHESMHGGGRGRAGLHQQAG